MRAAPLLHLRLLDVAAAPHERVADGALVGAEHGHVAVVELLDDLERPAAGQDVAPEQLALERAGQLVRPARAQVLEHLVELEVRRADELVERVEVAAGALERLERLAHLPRRRDGVVAGAGRPRVLVLHPPRPTRRARA